MKRKKNGIIIHTIVSYLLLEYAKLIASITRAKHTMDTRMLKKSLCFFIMGLHNTFLDNEQED